MRTSLALAFLLLAGTASAARKAVKPARAAKAHTPSSSAPKTAPQAPAPAKAAPSEDDALLFAFGAQLRVEPGEPGLLVAAVRRDSSADSLGLKPGDRVLSLFGLTPATPTEAAAALRAWPAQSRAGAVVRRGLEVAALAGPAPRPLSHEARRAGSLSPRERALATTSAALATASAAAALASAPSLAVVVRADQGLWVRFPEGLRAGLKPGDQVTAETASAVTTDASLDFLAFPPKSRVQAKVLEASDDGELRSVRLYFHRIEVAGGGTYPLHAVATALSADEALARATAGGTILAAAPQPAADGRRAKGPDLLLDPAARVRLRLLEPVTLLEPPSFWRAGPGLWLRSIEKDGERLFEVTHAIAGRAAAVAGLKAGDLLASVGGRSASRLDFSDAVDALYGEPGSDVKVALAGKSGGSLILRRGATWSGGKPSALPLPFQTR